MKRLPSFNVGLLCSLFCLLASGVAQASVQSAGGDGVQDDSTDAEIVISNTAPAMAADETSAAVPPLPTHWQTHSLPYQAEVQAAAQATQLDPALIHAVIATESGYNPRAVSPKGAYGLMQVMPATAQTLTGVPVRYWSVKEQILWGSHYLRRMLDMFEGNVSLALAAYNAGPQAVKTHQHQIPPFAETRRYVPKVLGYYQRFKTRLAVSSANHLLQE